MPMLVIMPCAQVPGAVQGTVTLLAATGHLGSSWASRTNVPRTFLLPWELPGASSAMFNPQNPELQTGQFLLQSHS